VLVFAYVSRLVCFNHLIQFLLLLLQWRRAFVRFFCFARSYTFTLKKLGVSRPFVKPFSLHLLYYSSHYKRLFLLTTLLQALHFTLPCASCSLSPSSLLLLLHMFQEKQLSRTWTDYDMPWTLFGHGNWPLIKVFVNSFGHSKAAVCGLWFGEIGYKFWMEFEASLMRDGLLVRWLIFLFVESKISVAAPTVMATSRVVSRVSSCWLAGWLAHYVAEGWYPEAW